MARLAPNAAATLVAWSVACLSCSSCSSPRLDPNCLLEERSDWGPGGTVKISVEAIASGLEVPWGLAFLPEDGLLVTERPGRVRRIAPDGTNVVVAEVDVLDDGEGGLLGIALSPTFADDRAFFVYVTSDASNRVERWTLGADGATASKESDILTGIPSARFHNGGRLRIGPDGMLYVGTGDAREPELSQDAKSLAGKLLRIRPDGTLPDDNPIAGSAVYVLGIRNTQGFDWRDDGSLLITDHGPSGDTDRRHHDEVSVARPGDNLGWPDIYACEAELGKVSPLIAFNPALPPGGAAIYRGDEIPEWRGDLLVGSLGATHLHRIRVDDAGRQVLEHDVYLRNTFGRLRDVVVGPDGFVYVTTSNCDGRGECPETGDAILRIGAADE